jgi:thiol:disulfide interchange protein DsbD
LTTYVYEDEVVLLVPLKIAADVPAGPLDLKAKISWLECQQECVLGHGDVEAPLTIGGESTSSPDAPLIAAWQKKLPLNQPGFTARAWWEKPAAADTRPIVFEWPSVSGGTGADFYPNSSENYDVQFPVETLPSDPGKMRLKKTVKKLEGDWPQQIAGLLIQKSGADTVAYEVNLPIGGGAGMVSGASSAMAQTSGDGGSLLKWLLGAFIGGLILNIMPCVLPVIALKILGFVSQARQEPARVRKFGLIYAAGVLISFLALALLVIAVKAAGHAASWGMQFQNPQFVVLMTALMTLVALNFFGVFEVNLGGRTMDTAGNLASREGGAGAFFNGILATALATPCTAPFLAGALGFAFTQTSATILMIFLAAGLGLAAPYVVLSWQPEWLKFLPKPGAWMEKFKMAMGFPMLATAVWLFTLATPNFGDNGDLSLGLFLVLLALAAWVWGEFVQRGRTRRALASAMCVAILAAAYIFVLENQLDWRHPVISKTGKNTLAAAPSGIDWQPWSPEALQAARATGRPVLVDFTAKWCVTCQLDVKPSLESESVRAKIKELNVVPLLENSYAKDETVVAELNRYQRAGVPLVLVYPRIPEAPPEVLPNLLTPGIVLAALDRAAAMPNGASAKP